MKTVELNIRVEKPFGNLFRKECVLIAVYDHEDKLLLGEKPDLKALIDNYNSLSSMLWYKGGEGEFSWRDYAQVYAPIHEEVLLDWEKNDEPKS